MLESVEEPPTSVDIVADVKTTDPNTYWPPEPPPPAILGVADL